MTTSTLTLTDFLLARIAEDEYDIRSAVKMREAWPYGSSVRFLAECEARRGIVAVLTDGGRLAWDGMAAANRNVLQYLALPYADHPEYREEWRP